MIDSSKHRGPSQPPQTMHTFVDQTWGSLFAAVIIIGLLLYFLSFQSMGADPHRTFWQGQPCVGLKHHCFAWTRATLKSIWRSEANVAQGYAKFSRIGRPFVLPSIYIGPVLVIPPSEIRHVLGKPQGEIDVLGEQNKSIQSAYTIRDKEVYVNNFQIHILRKQLKKNLACLTGDLAEEIPLAFERVWGNSEEWRTIPAWESMLKVVSQSANRLFAGLDLCRNEAFLEHSRRYSMSMFGGATVINMFPSFLQPLVGWVVGQVTKRHLKSCMKIALPVVVERQRMIEKSGDKTVPAWRPPNDGLQWVMDLCYETGDPKQLQPSLIVHRWLSLNMVAIHTTSFTITNAILDLYSADPSTGFVEALREESERIVAEYEGTLSDKAVSRLHRVDSAIKESMRVSAFGTVALSRRVSAPKGIDLECGIHIPSGIRLGFPVAEVQRDESNYSSATIYNAFRFCGQLNGNAMATGRHPSNEAETQERLDKEKHHQQHQQIPLTTPTDTFLSFGHGRHSCPGRFLAAHLMKLMLACIVRHYDVEYMPKRPAMSHILENKFPDYNTTIRIRKRATNI